MPPASNVYSTPILIDSTATLKSIARDGAGNIVGPMTTQEYVINRIVTSSSGGGGGGGGFVGGGGGGSSGGSFTADGQAFTYADSHFVQHPLDRIQFVTIGAMNPFQNIVMTSVNPGQQVNISATFKNYQNSPQSYVFIAQVEKDGITFSIDWATGTVNAGQTDTASRLWTPADDYGPGDYIVKVFVWDKLGGSSPPTALSEVGVSRISVAPTPAQQQQHGELQQI
jgi:hypothetical protein